MQSADECRYAGSLARSKDRPFAKCARHVEHALMMVAKSKRRGDKLRSRRGHVLSRGMGTALAVLVDASRWGARSCFSSVISTRLRFACGFQIVHTCWESVSLPCAPLRLSLASTTLLYTAYRCWPLELSIGHFAMGPSPQKRHIHDSIHGAGALLNICQCLLLPTIFSGIRRACVGHRRYVRCPLCVKMYRVLLTYHIASTSKGCGISNN